MSSQSIIHKDLQTLSDNADNVYMCMANGLMRQKRFGIGDGYDKNDFLRLKYLERILCNDMCQLDHVKCKVEEGINLLTIKYL